MNVPSGNLYRFIAFFGAALFFLTLVFYVFLLEPDRDQTANIQREMLRYSHERETLIGKIKELEKESAPTDTVQLVDLFEKEELAGYKDQINLRSKQLNLESELLEKQAARENQVRKIFTVSAGISLLILLLGLIFWYTKFQRIQNLLLRHQARKQLSE